MFILSRYSVCWGAIWWIRVYPAAGCGNYSRSHVYCLSWQLSWKIAAVSFCTGRCNLNPFIYESKSRDSYPVNLINLTPTFLSVFIVKSHAHSYFYLTAWWICALTGGVFFLSFFTQFFSIHSQWAHFLPFFMAIWGKTKDCLNEALPGEEQLKSGRIQKENLYQHIIWITLSLQRFPPSIHHVHN